MWEKQRISFFRRKLLAWSKDNLRDFPWRRDDISNYQLIITEILLQRTKAETVSKYYNTFFGRYPNWQSITDANIQDLEQILKPLGLYQHRAKRLFKIIQEYQAKKGELPKNKNELRDSNLSTLYISNAYELFILNHRSALLDVNMSRVLGRFFSLQPHKDVRHNKFMQEAAKKVLNVKLCKELNWSILDFAALVCKSSNPLCNKCIVKTKCKYFMLINEKQKDNTVEEHHLTLKYENKVPEHPNRPLKVVSLFSGCGGMDLGFEGNFLVHKDSINEYTNPDFKSDSTDGDYVKLNPTIFQTVFANDIIHEARNSWVNYFQKKGYSTEIYHVDSLVDLVKAHKQGAKIFPDHVDIVTGGFPCQDFSVAGKRNGFNSHKDHVGKLVKNNIPSIETRGQLYMWLKEVVEITKPNIFIAENVKGMVNLDNVKEIIQQDFANANSNGYLVLNPKVLHAADYGVPQSRERIIFIGIKKSALTVKALKELSKENINNLYNPYPQPSHAYTIKGDRLKAPVKLVSIFRALSEPEVSNDPSQIHYSKAKFMGKHCQGQTEIDLNNISPTIRAEHHGNIEFRRLSLKNGGKIYDEVNNKKLKERRLTPRECALIQTFPPDYDFVIPTDGRKFLVSASAAYKLIGNAVPPLLAYHIAKRIEKVWKLYFNVHIDGSIKQPSTESSRI